MENITLKRVHEVIARLVIDGKITELKTSIFDLLFNYLSNETLIQDDRQTPNFYKNLLSVNTKPLTINDILHTQEFILRLTEVDKKCSFMGINFTKKDADYIVKYNQDIIDFSNLLNSYLNIEFLTENNYYSINGKKPISSEINELLSYLSTNMYRYESVDRLFKTLINTLLFESNYDVDFSNLYSVPCNENELGMMKKIINLCDKVSEEINIPEYELECLVDELTHHVNVDDFNNLLESFLIHSINEMDMIKWLNKFTFDGFNYHIDTNAYLKLFKKLTNFVEYASEQNINELYVINKLILFITENHGEKSDLLFIAEYMYNNITDSKSENIKSKSIQITHYPMLA